MCKNCHDQELNYADFKDDAMHRDTQISHETYMAMTDDDSVFPFMHIPGWRHELNFFDLMHNANLGFVRDLAGTVLSEIAEERSPAGQHPDIVLQKLQTKLETWCKHFELHRPTCRLTMATLGRHTSRTFPSLPSEVKAAHVHSVLYWLSELVCELPHRTMYEKVRATCLWAYCDAHYTLNNAGMFLQKQESARAVRSASLFLVAYQWLAGAAMQSCSCQYKVRPKLHYYEHTVRL